MIDIKKLTKEDEGKIVVYKTGHGTIEIGILKSWNDFFIFVVYPGNNDDKKINWQNYTAAATKPEDLTWYEDYNSNNVGRPKISK